MRRVRTSGLLPRIRILPFDKSLMRDSAHVGAQSIGTVNTRHNEFCPALCGTTSIGCQGSCLLAAEETSLLGVVRMAWSASAGYGSSIFLSNQLSPYWKLLVTVENHSIVDRYTTDPKPGSPTATEMGKHCTSSHCSQI